MNDNVKTLPALSVRQQAEQEVREERAKKAKEKMKTLLRQRADAEAVLKGIDLQIKDLEQQIEDGTAI